MAWRQAWVGVMGMGMATAVAVAEPSLPIAFDQGNPPSMWGEAGQARGVYPTLVTEAALQAGLRVRLSALPWPRALAELEAGTGCVGGAYATPERRRRFQFSEAIWTERIVAVSLGHKALPPVTRWQDLKGQVVGLHRGWSYGETLDRALDGPELKTVRMTYGDRLFMALQAGKVDVVLTDADNVGFEARRLGLEVAVRGTLSHNTTHVICPPGADFGAGLHRLDAGLRRLQEQGRVAALVEAQVRAGEAAKGHPK